MRCKGENVAYQCQYEGHFLFEDAETNENVLIWLLAELFGGGGQLRGCDEDDRACMQERTSLMW